MKTIPSLILFAFATVAACSSDNTDDMPVPEPIRADSIAPVDSAVQLPLPIVKSYSPEEFAQLFVGGIWYERSIYDVYEDGTLVDVLKEGEIVGFHRSYIKALTDSTARLYTPVEDPYAPDGDRIISYSYGDGNQLQLFGYIDYLAKPLTVLEITSESIRCLGEVYSKLWAPDAVYGLYELKRCSDEYAAIVEERWENGEKWYK